MYKIVIMIMTTIYIYGNGYTLNKQCDNIDFTKIEYETHKTFRGDEVYGIQYGLKNTSNKSVKWKIHVDLFDTEKHIVDEMNFNGTLKPYREKGFSKHTYIPVGEDLSTFSGDINITLSCNTQTTRNNETNSMGESDRIMLKKSAFKMFNGKNKLEASMEAGFILKLVDENGGFKKFIEKIKPCLKK